VRYTLRTERAIPLLFHVAAGRPPLATWWTFATVTWARRLVSLHGLRADRPHLSLTGVVVEVQEVGSVQETGRTPIEGTDRA
jgi:hypothetical protein